MKTPEELAKEHGITHVPIDKFIEAMEVAYKAGYKAAGAKLDKVYKQGALDASPQWISVKDRLPKINDLGISDDILVRNWFGQMAVTCVCVSNGEATIEWGEAGNLPIALFTHWMPLPKPPE